MGKFTVSLANPYTDEIGAEFISRGYNIKYVDSLLRDVLYIEGTSQNELSDIKFIKSVEVTRIGSLLGIFKGAKKPTLQVFPSPSIDLTPIQNQGLYGLGVKVAVIDSGYDDETACRVEESINFTTDHSEKDRSGHGSIVMTIIKNMAPASKIYSAKVCIEDNDVDEEFVSRALDWARTIPELKIINMSIGFDSSCLGDCNLARKVNKMAELGYIIMAAVGNDGSKGKLTFCPACSEKAISVGSLNNDGTQVAEFSCLGHINSNKPDLIAPG